MKRNGRTSSPWRRLSQGAKTALCSLVLLFTMQSAGAAGFQYKGITYAVNSDNSSVTATGFDAKVVTPPTFVIPDYAFDGEKRYAVTVIKDNAFASTEMKNYQKVVIGDNVTAIGTKAFEHFGEASGYYTLVMGKNVTACDTKAFEHFGEHPVNGYRSMVILQTDNPANIAKQTFEHAKNTTFYVKDEDVYNLYKADEGWKQYAVDKKDGCFFTYPFPVDITFTTDQWQTAVFPEDLSGDLLEELFGQGTKVAKLCEDKHQWDGKEQYVVRFDLLEGVSRNVPVLIKPANKDCHYVSPQSYGIDSYADNPRVTMTDTENEVKVDMIGICNADYNLDFGQIYMRNISGDMQFFMADNAESNPEEKSNVWVKRGKCIFEMRDLTTGDFLTEVQMAYDIQPQATAIVDLQQGKRAARAGVYSLTGQYEGATVDGLAKGIHIVGGRKVVVK